MRTPRGVPHATRVSCACWRMPGSWLTCRLRAVRMCHVPHCLPPCLRRPRCQSQARTKAEAKLRAQVNAKKRSWRNVMTCGFVTNLIVLLFAVWAATALVQNLSTAEIASYDPFEVRHA